MSKLASAATAAAALAAAVPLAAGAATHGARACTPPKADRARTWEVVFATVRVKRQATALAARIDKGGLRVAVESEGCGRFQVAAVGLRTKAAASTLAKEIRAHGEPVTLERG